MKNQIRVLCCLCAWLLAARSASAAPPPQVPPVDPTAQPQSVELVRLDFGPAGDGVAANRFNPITVWLTSRDAPASGIINIEVDQDQTQRASYALPFATTPGIATPHELTVYVPSEYATLDFKLAAPNILIKRTFSKYGNQGDQNGLLVLSGNAANILVIGDCPFAERSFKGLTSAEVIGAKSAGTDNPWQECNAAAIQTSEMFLSWMAYDAVDLVVTNADSLAQADSRAILALNTWVESGGRLLMIADGAGQSWTKAWSSRDTLPVALEDSRRLAPKDEYLALLGRSDENPLPPLAKDAPRAPEFSLMARDLRVTKYGESLGWIARWECSAAGSDVAHPPALFVSGPRLGGQIGILAADPQRMSPTLSSHAANLVYRAAAAALLPHSTLAVESHAYSRFGPGNINSRERACDTALHQWVTETCDVPALGYGAYISIGVLMLVLSAALGLLDGLVIRRRFKHGSATWWSSLTWITIASAGALITPALIRSGESRLQHHAVVDVICEESSSFAWQTDCLAMFAGKPLATTVPRPPDGSWYRGVSAFDNFSRPGRAFSSLVLPVHDAANGLREAVPERFGQNQWTLRLVSGVSPTAPSTIRAVILPKAGFEQLQLSGMPLEGTLHLDVLATFDSRIQLDFDMPRDSEGHYAANLCPEKGMESREASGNDSASVDDSGQVRNSSQIDFCDYLLGPHARTGTLEQMRHSPSSGWATLYATLTQKSAEVPKDGIQRTTQIRFRITFPLARETAQVVQQASMKQPLKMTRQSEPQSSTPPRNQPAEQHP
jgi:hypothetical protein